MKLSSKFLAVACAATLVNTSVVFAGESKVVKEVIVEEEARKWWGAALSTGWDSRYIFRGVDIIPGSSLSWTKLNVTVSPWENGTFLVGAWVAFGLTNSSYKEVDIYASYTHTFGNLTLTTGYTFYDIMPGVGSDNLYSNELNVGANYLFDVGFMKITPGVYYFFNIGPAVGGTDGVSPEAGSYLSFRLDTSIPIKKDVISVDPYFAFNLNFRYNQSEDPDSVPGNDGRPFFSGVNNIEFGARIPWRINDTITVSGYVAASFQWYDLIGTAPGLVYGGADVTFAF